MDARVGVDQLAHLANFQCKSSIGERFLHPLAVKHTEVAVLFVRSAMTLFLGLSDRNLDITHVTEQTRD